MLFRNETKQNYFTFGIKYLMLILNFLSINKMFSLADTTLINYDVFFLLHCSNL